MSESKSDTLPLGDGTIYWSGIRDSNSQQPVWKTGTLPIELIPHIFSILPNLTENGELANLSTYGLVRLACKALLT